MKSTGTIESGKMYSLADLFGGDNKLVIPDLQRDYCWGRDAWVKSEAKFSDLVSGFVAGLFELYGQNDSHAEHEAQTLGLIYGYEQPKGRIQICDGQQRLTTLFLLLGYVNIKTKGLFTDYLMSEEERKDDFEPRLLYAIRESTLYFLSDLTKEVFIEKTTALDVLLSAFKKPKEHGFPAWYFQEYDLDTSIQNMLAALGSIDSVAQEHQDVDWELFGNYLINKLHFLYYDMGSRSRGEETYIVINTTGEPLSPSENIKPIVVGSVQDAERRKHIAEEWEEREEWFWQNSGQHKTSDAYSYRFLVWYWQIGLLQNKRWQDDIPHELSPRNLFLKCPSSTPVANGENASVDRWETFRNPDTIHSYFKAFQQLVKFVAGDDVMRAIFRSVSSGVFRNEEFRGTLADFFDRKPDEDKNWRLNMVLPAVAYLHKFPNIALGQLRNFIARLRKNFFDLWRVRNPSGETPARSGSYVDWRHVIQIVEKSNAEDDVLTFETIGHRDEFKKGVALNEWFGQSEKTRQFLASHGVDVATWEGHRALMGDLTPIVVIKDDGSIDLNKTKRRWENLQILSACIEKKQTNPNFNSEVANWYRLFRVLGGIVSIEHQPYTPWNLVGCFYSRCWDSLEFDFAFLKKPCFVELLSSDNLLTELQKQCIGTLKTDGLLSLSETMTSTQLLKAYLFAKTLVCEKTVINFYDGNPISIDTSIPNNKLNQNLPMSWGNLVCQYGYKFGWRSLGHSGIEYLDTTLAGDPVGNNAVATEKINEVTKMIEGRITVFCEAY